MVHKVYISCDGDSIGAKIGKAGLADDIETMARISSDINIAGTHAREWIESRGGRIIVLGGDEINAELPLEAAEDLEELRQLWSKYANATLSIGVGDKISQAGIALVWAKLHGKDQIALFDEAKSAEVLEEMNAKESETESEKLGKEYFKKHEQLFEDLLKEEAAIKKQKGKKGLPVGTIRKWGGQEYIKTDNGWAYHGGQHHGKALGKTKEKPPEHKAATDQPVSKEPKEEQKESKPEPAKEEPKKLSREQAMDKFFKLSNDERKELSNKYDHDADKIIEHLMGDKEESKPKDTEDKSSKEDSKESKEDSIVSSDIEPAKPNTPEFHEQALEAEPTPREEAAEALEEEKKDYINASHDFNLGEDLVGSARQKALEWKDLATAEKNGTADKLITRDKLLKNEPFLPDFKVTDDNWDKAILMKVAMEGFPPKPTSLVYNKHTDKYIGPDDVAAIKAENGNYISVDSLVGKSGMSQAFWDATKEGPDAVKKVIDHILQNVDSKNLVTKKEIGTESRKAYLDLFNQVKNKAEQVVNNPFESSDTPQIAETIQKFRKEVSNIINTRRMEYGPHDEASNGLIPYVRNFLNIRGKSNSLVGKAHPIFKAVHDSGKRIEKAQEYIDGAKVVEGKKKKTFNPATAYTTEVKREGPENQKLATFKGQHDFLMKEGKLRGLNFGNSITEAEKDFHMKELSNAFDDLTDILGLPKEMISFNNRLGIGVAFNGKGTALAHYEPATNIINLTRKGGVGSLAHEWSHFLDHTLAKNIFNGSIDSHLSEAGVRGESNEVGKKMNNLVTSDHWIKYKQKVKEAWRQKVREGMISGSSADYWLSNREMFARAFEVYTTHKLNEKGRENTYLAGLQMDEVEDIGLWPNENEIKEMAPLFDDFFKTLSGSEEIKKFESFGNSEQLQKNDPTVEERPWFDYTICLEYLKGSKRTYGQYYDKLMMCDYGYFQDVPSTDGMELDCYLGPGFNQDDQTQTIFVIAQRNAHTQAFDEDKIMLGFKTEEEAKFAYVYHMGEERFGGIKAISYQDFSETLGKKQPK